MENAVAAETSSSAEDAASEEGGGGAGRAALISDYDRRALAEIRSFKNPKRGLWRRVKETVNTPLTKIGDAVYNTALGSSLGALMDRVLLTLNDAASWTLREEQVLKAYQEAGYGQIDRLEDIRHLQLHEVDGVRGNLHRKYQAVAFGEGAAAGVTGVVGLVVDIPALLVMALRAIGEYATYHGFDMRTGEEQAYALQILTLASATTHTSQQIAAKELTELGVDISNERCCKQAEKALSTVLAKKLVETLAKRFSKGKIAQAIPLVGLAVGGTYNASYLGDVCRTAEAMYRERFLMARYGSEAVREKTGVGSAPRA